jgi:phasin family protein
LRCTIASASFSTITEPEERNEMQYDYVKQLTNAGKSSYESLQELGTINAKAIQKLSELQFKFASYNIETGIEQTKLLTSTTNYKDLLAAESEIAGDYSAKAIDFTRLAASILSESRDEIMSWFEKGFDKAETVSTPPVKRTTKKSS